MKFVNVSPTLLSVFFSHSCIPHFPQRKAIWQTELQWSVSDNLLLLSEEFAFLKSLERAIENQRNDSFAPVPIGRGAILGGLNCSEIFSIYV